MAPGCRKQIVPLPRSTDMTGRPWWSARMALTCASPFWEYTQTMMGRSSSPTRLATLIQQRKWRHTRNAGRAHQPLRPGTCFRGDQRGARRYVVGWPRPAYVVGQEEGWGAAAARPLARAPPWRSRCQGRLCAGFSTPTETQLAWDSTAPNPCSFPRTSGNAQSTSFWISRRTHKNLLAGHTASQTHWVLPHNWIDRLASASRLATARLGPTAQWRQQASGSFTAAGPGKILRASGARPLSEQDKKLHFPLRNGWCGSHEAAFP